DPRRGLTRGLTRRAARPALRARVRPASPPHDASQPGSAQGAHPGPGLGLQLLRRRQQRGGLHPVPAAEAGRRAAPADPDGSGGWLPDQGVRPRPSTLNRFHSLRWRLTFLYLGLLLLLLLLLGIGQYLAARELLFRSNADVLAT